MNRFGVRPKRRPFKESIKWTCLRLFFLYKVIFALQGKRQKLSLKPSLRVRIGDAGDLGFLGPGMPDLVTEPCPPKTLLRCLDK